IIERVILYLDGDTHFKVPKLIRSVSGNYTEFLTLENDPSEPRAMRLSIYVPGILINDLPEITDHHLIELGEACAHITNKLQKFQCSGLIIKRKSFNWALINVVKLRHLFNCVTEPDFRSMVEKAVDTFEREVVMCQQKFKQQVIHGDLNEQNIIKCDNGTICFIDFNDINYGPAVFDIALMITYMMLIRPEALRLSTANLLLRGYAKHRTLERQDYDILPICIKARLCQSLVLGRYAHSKDPQNSYVLTTARNGWSALKSLSSISDEELEDDCQLESRENDAGCRTETRYIGCLEIKVSMASLFPDARREIALECINRLCEATGLKQPGRSKPNEEVATMLAEEPNLDHSGANVHINISSEHLDLTLADESSEVIVRHEMSNVSFASDTSDLVAYVAKDKKFGRACFVLECNNGNAKTILTTFARAFAKRSQQYINAKRAIRNGTLRTDRFSDVIFPNFINTDLIDFKSEVQDSPVQPSPPMSEITTNLDPDITEPIRQSVAEEDWFHGSGLSREQSEKLLHEDGDFLVRESILNPGQFVLTGIQKNKIYHLLLLDRNGVVRTKDQVFDSIKHLLNYHHAEGLPIVSAEGALYLRRGVSRRDS
ncbi:SHC-transforming protein 2, partial [Fragariocoptes setiger]